jgi:hypothetical protein
MKHFFLPNLQPEIKPRILRTWITRVSCICLKDRITIWKGGVKNRHASPLVSNGLTMTIKHFMFKFFTCSQTSIFFSNKKCWEIIFRTFFEHQNQLFSRSCSRVEQKRKGVSDVDSSKVGNVMDLENIEFFKSYFIKYRQPCKRNLLLKN